MRKFISLLGLFILTLLWVSCQSKQELVKNEKGRSLNVVTIPDIQPEFTRGNVSAWIAARLKYPESAVRKQATGRVFVEFVISKKGKVINSRVIRSSGDKALDAEALRVVSELPRWKPGHLKGKKVAIQYVLPVTFSFRR